MSEALRRALGLMAEVRDIRVETRDGSAVAIVPTELGWERVERHGKDALVADLRGRLSRAGQMPRRWRLVRRLPAPNQAACPLHPDWTELARDETTWHGETVVADNLAVLQGHFPKEPVVPGVAQLFWAAVLARRAFPDLAMTGELRNLKFMKVIVPGLRLRNSLAVQDGQRPRIAFEYSSGSTVHSRGFFVLC